MLPDGFTAPPGLTTRLIETLPELDDTAEELDCEEVGLEDVDEDTAELDELLELDTLCDEVALDEDVLVTLEFVALELVAGVESLTPPPQADKIPIHAIASKDLWRIRLFSNMCAPDYIY